MHRGQASATMRHIPGCQDLLILFFIHITNTRNINRQRNLIEGLGVKWPDITLNSVPNWPFNHKIKGISHTIDPIRLMSDHG